MSASILRAAAAKIQEEWSVRTADLFCNCEASDSWFDRSICPEPCDSMHNICVDCGRVQGYCSVAISGRDNGNRLALSWLAVADWLEEAAADLDSRQRSVNGLLAGIGAEGDVQIDAEALQPAALTLARTYLKDPS